jgi:hypothetical protein
MVAKSTESGEDPATVSSRRRSLHGPGVRKRLDFRETSLFLQTSQKGIDNDFAEMEGEKETTI